MKTKENQEKLRIYSKGDHSRFPKWTTERKGMCFSFKAYWYSIRGQLGPNYLLVIYPLLLCNGGPFQPRINDRMAPTAISGGENKVGKKPPMVVVWIKINGQQM